MQINWLKNVSYNVMYDDDDDDDEIQSLRGTFRTEKRSECAEWLTAVKYRREDSNEIYFLSEKGLSQHLFPLNDNTSLHSNYIKMIPDILKFKWHLYAAALLLCVVNGIFLSSPYAYNIIAF